MGSPGCTVDSPAGRELRPDDGAVVPGALSDRAQRIRALSVERWGEQRAVEIVGRAPCLLDLQLRLEKIAAYREPVLITGESGVGKDHVAQTIYLLGHSKRQPYVTVNCPQYQDGNLTVSELFGHKRGSFTGAVADRRGAFREADGGLIFLDEIGDLHSGAQAMLLRTLSTGEYRSLGSDQSSVVDVRVVSATNRPLNQLMATGEFRNDLFFRLRHFHLVVPPLRDRGDDWQLLAEHVLARLRQKYGVAKRLSSASLKCLEQCTWPGNVRQLTSVVTMAYAISDGDKIKPDDFASELEATAERSENLFDRVVTDREDFWEAVHAAFMNRELNQTQVRAVVRQGLVAAQGSYRRLLGILHLPSSDYQRFMDFLRHHDLKP
jgi:DNA-binding NtrC family response regulator